MWLFQDWTTVGELELEFGQRLVGCLKRCCSGCRLSQQKWQGVADRKLADQKRIDLRERQSASTLLQHEWSCNTLTVPSLLQHPRRGVSVTGITSPIIPVALLLGQPIGSTALDVCRLLLRYIHDRRSLGAGIIDYSQGYLLRLLTATILWSIKNETLLFSR